MLQTQKRILITGVTGFVGAHIARRMTSMGHDVHALVRKNSDFWRITDVIDQITLHEGELSNLDSLASIIDKVKPEGVFHLGALTYNMNGLSASPQQMIDANLWGTVNLIDAMAHIDYKFFVHTGSFTEYRGEERPVNELDFCEPKEIYGITKLSSTLYAKAVGKIKNKPVVALRLFTPYGPLIQKGKLIEQLILNSFEGKTIKLTRPTISRDYVYIDDLVDLYIEAANLADRFKGEIFNAGSGVKTTIGEVLEYVVRVTKSKSEIIWDKGAAVAYDLDSWQADMTKTFSSFAWRPRHSFEMGIDKMIDFYRELKDK